MKKILTPILSLYTVLLFSQYDIKIFVELDTLSNVLEVNQEIEVIQSNNIKEDLIFLLDWNNSFISKQTPLAKSFSEEYNKIFHLAKNKERGFTNIKSIKNGNGDKFTIWDRYSLLLPLFPLFFTQRKQKLINKLKTFKAQN